MTVAGATVHAYAHELAKRFHDIGLSVKSIHVDDMDTATPKGRIRLAGVRPASELKPLPPPNAHLSIEVYAK